MHYYIKLRYIALYKHFLRPATYFSKNAIMSEFEKRCCNITQIFEKAKHLIDIYYLKINTKQELLSIIMQDSETVN